MSVDPSKFSVQAEPAAKSPRRTREFMIVPIPKRCQESDEPFEFSLFLNAVFGFASTFSAFCAFRLD